MRKFFGLGFLGFILPKAPFVFIHAIMPPHMFLAMLTPIITGLLALKNQ